MSKLDKIAGKTKQVVAEVVGDGKLNEEGRRQERRAEREADEDGKVKLSSIANNLT